MITERVLYNVTHYRVIILKGTFAGTESDVLAYDGVSVSKRRRFYHCDRPISRKDFDFLPSSYGRPFYQIISEDCGGIVSLRTLYY